MTGALLRIDPAVGMLIAASFALLFGAAAAHKVRDLRRFDAIFSAYGLLPGLAAVKLSRLVPLLEATVAFGLLYRPARDIAALTGILLLVAYAGAIAVNLARGRRDLACGCGGPDERRPIAGWMVWRNLALAAVLGAITLPWSDRAYELSDAVTITLGTLACALVYLCLDQLASLSARSGNPLRHS